MHSSNGTTWRHALKNLAFRIFTSVPLSRWYCGESQCESLNMTRPRVQVSRAAQHHYLSVAILVEIKILSSISSIRDSKKLYKIDSNVNKCHWHWPMREQLRRCSKNIWAISQPLLSTTLPVCKTATTCHQNHMIHRNGIIPWRWNHTIPWEWNYTMVSYHGIIPWAWNHTIPYTEIH